jgi:hypothetical protein
MGVESQDGCQHLVECLLVRYEEDCHPEGSWVRNTALQPLDSSAALAVWPSEL